MKRLRLWVVLGGFLLLWTGATGRVSAQVDPGGLEVDPAEVREEMAAVQQEILAYRQAGEAVPRDLLDHQRELQRLLPRPASTRRPAARDPLQSAELRAEYAELQAEMRERRAAGVEVPPELQARISTLRRQLQPPRASSKSKSSRSSTARRQRVEEQLRELHRETEALAAEGQPIPPQLVAREKALRRQLNQARQTSQKQSGAMAQRQLDSLRRQIERLESAGRPVPDSLYQRAEALERAANQGAKGGRRTTRADLERELNRLIEQADRLEAEGRPVPDSIMQRGRELEQKLADGDFEDAGSPGRVDGRARAGTDPTRPKSAQTGQRGGVDPDSLRQQLAKIESSIARIEASGAAVPSALERHYLVLQRRLESLGIEMKPEPIAAADNRPESELDKRQKDENRFRELQNFIAAAEERGVPIAENVIREIEALDRSLYGPPGAEPLKPEAKPTAAGRGDPRDDEERLAKMYDVAERLEAIGQPIPQNLIQSIQRLEKQLNGAAPDPVALESESPRKPRPGRANGETDAVARLQGLERELQNLRESGQQPTWDLINELRELRREEGMRGGAGANPKTRALETRLDAVVTAMRRYEDQGQPIPEQMVKLAEALQKQIEVANRAGSKTTGKKNASAKAVPFDGWPAYVNKQIAIRKLDAAARAEAMKILRECQTRARPLVASAAGDPGPARGAVTVQSTAQRRVNAIFTELKRRIGALGKGGPAKRAQVNRPAGSATRRR